MLGTQSFKKSDDINSWLHFRNFIEDFCAQKTAWNFIYLSQKDEKPGWPCYDLTVSTSFLMLWLSWALINGP